MTKENYMALADFQTLWKNVIKPFINETYATKNEVSANFASVSTCEEIISELT